MHRMLVIQGILPHYRRAFFNELAKHGDVIVVHSGTPARGAEDQFSEVVLPLQNAGPFRLQRGLLQTIDDHRPDIVIAMFDIRWVNSVRAMLRFDRRLRWIWWGLDEGGRLPTEAKCLLARRDNPIVFYNSAVRDRFKEIGLAPSKLFVANNTFHVEEARPTYDHPVKNKFINVGTLDPRKQNDVTIGVFKRLLGEPAASRLQLVLIGDGSEREALERLVAAEGLERHVVFPGKIDDPGVLSGRYSEAIASVSFGQAGLAVLQSMAFCVPFVTKRNAISGGEKHNIIDGQNGLFVEDDPADLERAMRSLVTSPTLARELGRNAYEHYRTRASLANMVDGFLGAIQYAERRRG